MSKQLTLKTIEDTNISDSESLAQLAKDLGYGDSSFGQLYFRNGACATNLFEFLDDNPGAIEAVVNWVLENGCFADGQEIPEDVEEDIIEDE